MAAETDHGAMADMTGGTSLEHLPFDLGAPVMHGLERLAICIDLFGVAIILFGFFVALIDLFRAFSKGIGLRRELMGLSHARTTLATYILTGLEFMIASDIIHTVITRQFSDLLFVGLLVLIRTAISFFLGKEVVELERNDGHR